MAAAASSACVLLVEDQEEFRFLIRQALEERGWAVVSAENAAQGRRLFAERPPDAVVLDANLPDGNGFDLCREMTSARPDVPVILCTVRASVGPAAQGLAAGAADYIVKPFEIGDLQERVAKALGARGRPG